MAAILLHVSVSHPKPSVKVMSGEEDGLCGDNRRGGGVLVGGFSVFPILW